MKQIQSSNTKKPTNLVNLARSQAAKKAAVTRKNNILKSQQLKWRISDIFRVVFFASLATLIFITVNHLVHATSLVQVSNDNGIPSSWQVVSATHPDSMTIPITYFDQQSDCLVFEFQKCSNLRDKTTGWTPNIVKNTLGSDGLPIPTNESSDNSLIATSKNVTGHDPVQSSDNFYQWFHAVDGKSTKYERELTFNRVGNENKYTYGGRQIFPLDDVPDAQITSGHNFHFTAHMKTPIKVSRSGTETFDFSGDDDVWVFLNGHLVLDIGGVHTAIDGSFTINQDGSVSSRIYEGRKTYSETTYDLGLEKDQVINLDLFYAERNTSEANTLITITDMEWLISTQATIDDELIDNKLVQYTASVKNCDTTNAITLEKISAHIVEDEKAGFVPLTGETLLYSNNPSSLTSWENLPISLPASSDDGFRLETPIALAPAGQSGDTAYVRFYAAPEANDADLNATVSFYLTDSAGDSGIAYSSSANSYHNLSVIEPEYIVSFDSAGGTTINPQTVTNNFTATRPTNPEKEKSIFTGWYLGGESYDFDSPVTDNITLVAHWETIPDEEYVVVFDSDGGTEIESQIVAEHSTATVPPIPSKPGYRFLGWTRQSSPYDFDNEVTENITLVANWEKVEFLVIFNPDGGSMVPTQTVYRGNAASEPANSLRDGYSFVGWYLDDEPYNFATPVTDDILLVAKWEKIVVPEPKPIISAPTPTSEPEPTPESEPSTPEHESAVVVPNPPVAPAQDPARVVATAERLIYDQTTDEDPMVAFLPVLGAVAYTPNTGLMTNLSATPFGGQAFSVIILSQPFLLATLTVFSLSFAIYYPLRRRKE